MSVLERRQLLIASYCRSSPFFGGDGILNHLSSTGGSGTGRLKKGDRDPEALDKIFSEDEQLFCSALRLKFEFFVFIRAARLSEGNVDGSSSNQSPPKGKERDALSSSGCRF